MKLNLFTVFSETKSPARLPVSRRASTRASTLCCFGKVESVTERRLESVILKETPVDMIIGRDTIKKYKLFEKIPSQLSSDGINRSEEHTSELQSRP